MELTESIETLNKRLVGIFGKFENGEPNYRIVWSTDQIEKIITEAGEAVEKPKYYASRNRHILERLTPVPISSNLTTKLSYEPVWTFQDKFGNALPPKWEAIFMIISTINANIHSTSNMAKYKDPAIDPEAEAERLKVLENELYGNETSTGDALAVDSAVGFGTRRRNDSRFDNFKLDI